MSDPISRDDAIEAFEEEKQKAKEIRDDFAKFPNSVFEQSIYNEAVKAWRLAINIVKKLPTIDAVPVARCKDCKHYKKSEVSDRMMCWRKDVDGQPVCYDFNPNDFCSYGERRTDGTNDE